MTRAAALAFLLLLAGCSEPPAADPGDAEAGDDASQASAPAFGAADQVPLGLQRLAFPGANHSAQATFTDAFAATDQCLVTPGGTPCSGLRRFDLTPLIPAGLPVQLDVVLTYDGSGGAFLFLQLHATDASIRYQASDGGSGEERFTALAVREEGGTVEAVVEAWQPALTPPGPTPFTLDVQTLGRPDVLPARLAVALDLRPGDGLALMGEDAETLRVADPTGASVDVEAGTPYNATQAGRHVVLALGQGDLFLAGPAATPLRTVATTLQTGAEHPLAGETTWETVPQGVVLAVQIAVSSRPQTGDVETLGRSSGLAVRIEQGGQVVHESRYECNPEGVPCRSTLTGPYRTWVASVPGAAFGNAPLRITVTAPDADGLQARDDLVLVAP